MSDPTYRFGPLMDEGGRVRFRLYAPDVSSVALALEGGARLAMEPSENGFFTVDAEGPRPGSQYRFLVGDQMVPDPASRGQADDADGWSVLVAPARPRPFTSRPWHEAIIAEVHVGTATPEGTFRALIDRLDHYRDAGFTVIELLPVADFMGKRNWGYDGVLLYAPDTAYGTPDDLRALIDAAHERGLGMMLDVVYNHFGPSGNYLPTYAKSFFREDISTPWGPAIDLENETVRAFFTENAAYWLREFGFDGLRFDAVHALATDGVETFLRELAASCRAAKPDAWLVLENHDNTAGWMTRDDGLYDAQWNDDWHHVFHVLGSGETHGYYAPYASDAPAGAARALAEGFVFQGEAYPGPDGEPRGEVSTGLPPDAFVTFVQNHDHVGNRALGDRLAGTVEHDRLAFLRFVLMLSPGVPLLFMGEEALLSKPFPFFCDFEGDLAEAVRKGRRSEFPDFFRDHDKNEFPDPLNEETFRSATIHAEDFDEPQAQEALAAFRSLADLRRDHIWPIAGTGWIDGRASRQNNVVAVAWHFKGGTLFMVLNPAATRGIIHQPAGTEGIAPAASVGEVTADDAANLTLAPFSAAFWSLRTP